MEDAGMAELVDIPSEPMPEDFEITNDHLRNALSIPA